MKYLGLRYPGLKSLSLQDKVTFTDIKVVNIYIVYLWPFKQSVNFTLENSLFGVAELTKNADLDKHKYSGYGSGCDTRGIFSLSDGGGFARNVIIFIADKSSSGHVDNRKKI